MPRPGSTSQRGYGHRHQQLRAWWAPKVAAGGVPCATCKLPIGPGEEWDLEHDEEGGRVRYLGPGHAECNRGKSRRSDAVTPAIDPPATLGPEWD